VKSISSAEPGLIWDTSPTNESPKSEWLDEDSPPGSSVLSLSPVKVKYDSLSPIEFSFHSDSTDLVSVSLTPGRLSPSTYLALANGVSIPWGLPVPKESMVTSLFFKNHVTWPRHDDSERGFLEALPSMYHNSSTNSLLHKAVNALALGTMSNACMSTSLRCEARREYGKALQGLGVAIKSASLATSDETLMSILLFAVYEQITWSYPSRDAWTRHVNGAVTLVKLRGQNQMATPVSKRLFRAVRTLMVMEFHSSGRERC
jgi:hypothetical protein